jgi:ketosteroid isomerase-like protein
MDEKKMYQLAESFLDAWNTQDVERVLACYTDDVRYVDPNTNGPVEGAEAMRRYLTKLFRSWKMQWRLKEAFMFDNHGGCAVLWRATLQRSEGGKSVDIDGMDLAVVRGDRLERNEVYFDRAALASLT